MAVLKELNRRNVIRMGIAYVLAAWFILQVIDFAIELTGAPSWILRVLFLAAVIGLPVTLVFSWAFELTPEGIRRESDIDPDKSITAQTGKRLNLLITSMLVLAVAYFTFDKLVLDPRRDADLLRQARLESTAPAEVADSTFKSIAVLPFVNMSDDRDNEYFSDGLTEELLNLLAKIPELKVASRTSSFQFKNEKFDIKEAAARLDVDHVLEGSVRKSGNQVRITAQLIKASDGYHMWSETYDRSLDNIFAIQDDISAEVIAALKVQLFGELPPTRALAEKPETYDLLLKSRYLRSLGGTENAARAIEASEKALNLEPKNWEALTSLSTASEASEFGAMVGSIQSGPLGDHLTEANK